MSAPRIIAGEWRSRPLATPVGAQTRPTASRARETLFSMLNSRLGTFSGRVVADFYAGSGALGLEALSRGAAHCTFIERDRAALAALARNIEILGAGPRADVRPGSLPSSLPARTLDLALIDPPYADHGWAAVLAALVDRHLLNAGAWVSIETGQDQWPARDGFSVVTTRDVGKARLTLLHRD